MILKIGFFLQIIYLYPPKQFLLVNCYMRIPKMCLDWKYIHNQKRKNCLDGQTEKQTDRRILHFCLDRQILPQNDFEDRFFLPNSLSISPENNFCWFIVTRGFKICVWIENPFIIKREKFVWTDRQTNRRTDPVLF